MDKSKLASIIDKLKKQTAEKKSLDPQSVINDNNETPTQITLPTAEEMYDEIKNFCLIMHLPSEYCDYEENEAIIKFKKVLTPIAKEYSQNAAKNADSENPPTPLEAKAYISFSNDMMAAYLFVFPPMHGGEDITLEGLNEFIEKNKVVEVIDTEAVERMVSDKQYCKIVKIATGKPSIDGMDGYVEHLITLNTEPTFVEDKNGYVDFKNLNIINEFPENTELCNIYYPTDGICGRNVLGKILPTKNGKDPKIPQGNNTHLSEDGSTLYTSILGTVSYVSGIYRAENVLTIKGDVDSGVGNIKFSGDVLVKGDVKSGFNIDAEGSIFVQGHVGSCRLFSGGDMVIAKGMNGKRKGYLRANGNLTSTYLEQCRIYCGQTLTADSIINCKVHCHGSILVTKGRGVLAGGSYIAFDSVTAKMIGSRANTPTNILITRSDKLAPERIELTKNLEETRQTYAKIEESLNVLLKIGVTNLDLKKRKAMMQLMEQKKLYVKQEKELADLLTEVTKIEFDYSQCRVTAKTIHAPTKIQIFQGMHTIRNGVDNSSYYLNSEGMVVLAAL